MGQQQRKPGPQGGSAASACTLGFTEQQQSADLPAYPVKQILPPSSLMLPAHSPPASDGSAVWVADAEGRLSEPSTPVAPSSSVIVSATPLSPILRVPAGPQGASPAQSQAQNLSVPGPVQNPRAVSPAQGLSVVVPAAAQPPQMQSQQPARAATGPHKYHPQPQRPQPTQPAHAQQQPNRPTRGHLRSATPPMSMGASAPSAAARTALGAQLHPAASANPTQQLPPRKNSAPVSMPNNATAPRAANGHSNGNGVTVAAAATAPPKSQPPSQPPSRRNSSIESALRKDACTTSTFFHACTDYHPLLSKRGEYFAPDLSTELPGAVGSISSAAMRPRADSLAAPLLRDVISVVVPCFTESGRSLQKTLYDLYRMQEFMHANKTWFHFHVCIILDGWSHAPPSLKAYIHQLFESEDEAEAVKWSTLQEEIKNAEDSAAYPETANMASTATESDDSSDSSDDETGDALLPESDRKVKASSSSAAVKFQHEKASAPKPSASKPSSYPTAKSSMTPGSTLGGGSDSFHFPESVTSGAFGTSSSASSKSSKRSWEKYISNWSADSDLNPPTQPETLIVQKWLTSSDGLSRSIKALPLFPGLRDDEMMGLEAQQAVPSDPEELRRKQHAALKMTVLIKRDNRRKHNSHEWFLTAFAPVYTTKLHASSTSATGVQLVFMTDAGTRFHRSCVLSLVQHALQNPTTVACSGRQRVMTHAMQNEGEPPVDKWSINFLRAQLYRCAQGFEYEASISAFNGAFDFVGMLPVLPGPCGLFRLDLIFREGDAVRQEKARQAEHVRIQSGQLRAIHVAENRALMELHKYVWTSLTVQKQMHRATWAAYCKRQQSQQVMLRASASATGGGLLEPFTPFEKAEAQFKFVELKTQLFTLTNELQRNQLLLITVLLRLDADSVCLHGLPQMLSQESIVWARMQSLLVLVKQLHELESTYSSMAADGLLSTRMPGGAALGDWDRQMHMQLEQLRRLLTQQIYQLKDYLGHIQKADGGLLSVIRNELSMDAADHEHLLETRALQSLAAARDPVSFYFSVVNQIPNEVDLITANLMLAEDRILSYAVVLMAPVPVHTDFVPDALFFFEAETEAENALQQSRRWTNGTVAGFLWLFFSGIRFKQRRYLVYLLVFAQLIMYCIVGLSPALWTIGLHYSLTTWFDDSPDKYGDWLVFLYLGLYALFVILHSDPTPGKKRLHVWLFHILTVVNMLVATLPIAALVPEFMRQSHREMRKDRRVASAFPVPHVLFTFVLLIRPSQMAVKIKTAG